MLVTAPCAVQTFGAVQPKMLDPALTDVSKNISPTEHVAGRLVPVLAGLVSAAAEKSMLLACVLKST
jgi:hypothetical protein